jgi:hypothetical protein
MHYNLIHTTQYTGSQRRSPGHASHALGCFEVVVYEYAFGKACIGYAKAHTTSKQPQRSQTFLQNRAPILEAFSSHCPA